DGRIRKFPGPFDYYFEKKDFLIKEAEHKSPQADTFREKQREERLKVKEEDRSRKLEEKKRKAHNSSIREKINKLENEKEKLQIESYAKARALSNPKIYRDEETAREYGRRMKEIEKRNVEIDLEVDGLEKEIV
ncbi:MAG: hypothetical protein PHP89_06365, partial [Candidatus Omnitrophica bacterium]|nr:hypothetical protein [Candidatus Omnitrophota bacterium]